MLNTLEYYSEKPPKWPKHAEKTQAFLHHFCRTDFKGLKAQNCGRGQRKLGTISWKPKAKSVKHRNEKLSCWRSICHFLSSEVLFSTQNDSFSISNVKCEKWFFTLNKKETNRILYPKFFQTLHHQILNVTCLKSVLCTLFENYPKCRIWIFELWHFPPFFVLAKLKFCHFCPLKM